MDFLQLKTWHQAAKEPFLFGRYITYHSIQPLLEKLGEAFVIQQLGVSVLGTPIDVITWGDGPIKVLGWSQMHGNESTTTKAVFDLFKWLEENENAVEVAELKEKVTIKIVPMLNPDGAAAYTRVNANGVDLNRDAQNRTQPESVLLYDLYTSFKPDLCLNLHGQRTIFGVGEPAKSATVSFLSPSQDELRTVTQSRRKGMAIIAQLAEMLENFIPGQVGRYDDGFNLNCVGDTLQHLNIPTILFEAGHFANDYDREESRAFMFLSLLGVLDSVVLHNLEENDDSKPYFLIPENKKCFYDIIIRSIQLPDFGLTDLAIQYEEQLINNQIHFVPKISQIADLESYIGHLEINFESQTPILGADFQLEVGAILETLQVNSEIPTTFSLKS